MHRYIIPLVHCHGYLHTFPISLEGGCLQELLIAALSNNRILVAFNLLQQRICKPELVRLRVLRRLHFSKSGQRTMEDND